MNDNQTIRALHQASNEVTKCWLESDRAANERDHNRTLALLEKAKSIEPDHPGVLLRLGHAYAKRFRFEEAETCFAKALAIIGPSEALLLQIGEYWKKFGRTKRAIATFEKAIEINADCVDAYLKIAELQERNHEVDAASGALERAIRLDPNAESTQYMQAIIARRNGDHEKAVSILQSLVRQKLRSIKLHVKAWHELGRYLDQQGDYDGAFAAFTSGKMMIARDAQSYKEAFSREKKLLVDLVRKVTKSQINEWKETNAIRRKRIAGPHVIFIGGVPRSGTTLAASVISGHSHVNVVDECFSFGPEIGDKIDRIRGKKKLKKQKIKKTRIVGLLDVLNQLNLELQDELFIRYRQGLIRWAEQEDHSKLIVDKNPALTQSLPIMIRIVPMLKSIIMKRDSRDVAISCFMQALPLNNISVNFHSLATTLEYVSFVHEIWDSIKMKLDDEDFLEVQYSELVNDFENQAKRMIVFLGLPWQENVLRFQSSATKTPMQSPTYEDVTKELYSSSINRWQNYQKFFEAGI